MNDYIFGTSLKSKGISQIIIDRIVSSIILGELGPGDKLPTEQEFSERTGAGKSSVREAIKILEAFGVVEIRRGKGAFLVEGFNDAMLTPTLLGMMLGGRDASHAMDFHRRVVIMVLMGIARQGTAPNAAKQALASLSSLDGSSDGATIVGSLRRAEEVLISFEANPIMRTLAQHAMRFSAARTGSPVLDAKQAASILEAVKKVLSKLCSGDADEAIALMGEEFLHGRAPFCSV